MAAVKNGSRAQLLLEIAEDGLSPRPLGKELLEQVLGESGTLQEIFPRTDSSPRQSSTIASFEVFSAFTPFGVTR